MKASRAIGVAVVALLGVLETGCLVRVTRERNPGAAFSRAREEALRFQGRPGPASELNLMAWNPDEGKMVRISVPLWLVRTAEGHVDWDEVDPDGEHEHWRQRTRGLRWEDIERSAPGILLEVLEDEGERVLVWLR